MYIFTITFLSKINDYISYREFHLILNELKSISLKTLIDYIDYSIQARIIKKVFRFDLKTNKTISSKAKYYFTDN
ncbi:ATP-binding protein [bacterium]|nr:ATP-binding protein [bacterium]